MSLADTAQLVVELKLNGVTAFRTGISEAEAAAAGLNRTVASSKNVLGGTTSNLALFRQAAISTGTALGGMASHLKGVITGPLGMLGLGAGLFTVAGALKGSIGKADEFSLAIEKLQGLTGDSADSLSQLIAVTDNYGISADRLTRLVGFTEKALGNLATTGKTADFAKQFGFSVTDAAGKVLPFNAILMKAADFYNSNADQSTKAALAAKLFGRSYADLVPILKLGSRGITEAEQAAKDLGITLTATNVQDLVKYRETTRTLGDAITGLQLQIGLGLVPTFTDLAHGVTTFLRDGGTAKIVTGFKSMLESAKELGAVVTGTVIPTIQGLAGTAKGFWDSIPAPLRDLIFKGVVADRTIHFLFGVSPISLGKSLIGDVVGPIFSQFAARGATPANPVFVSGVGLGSGGGVPVAGGGLGLASKVFLVGEAIGLGLLINDIRQGISDQNSAIATGLRDQTKQFLAAQPDKAALERSLAGVDQGIHDLEFNPLNVLVQGDALDKLRAIRADIAAQLAANEARHAYDVPSTPKPGSISTGGLSPDERQLLSDHRAAQVIDRRTGGNVVGAAAAQMALSIARRTERAGETAADRLSGVKGALLGIRSDIKRIPAPRLTVNLHTATSTFINGRLIDANLNRYKTTIVGSKGAFAEFG